MPTIKNTHQPDTIKKGYNEKNPSQPQGAFKPHSMEQAVHNKKPVAAKLHHKQQELDKDK